MEKYFVKVIKADGSEEVQVMGQKDAFFEATHIRMEAIMNKRKGICTDIVKVVFGVEKDGKEIVVEEYEM